LRNDRGKISIKKNKKILTAGKKIEKTFGDTIHFTSSCVTFEIIITVLSFETSASLSLRIGV
jgi:hypothetical protein